MRRTSIALLALLGVAFVPGCRGAQAPVAVPAEGAGATSEAKTEESGEHGAHEEHGDAGADVEIDAEGVRSAGIVARAVARVPFRAEIRVSGLVTTTPEGRAVVTPPVAGRVLRLLATVGQRVERGQPLALIESVDLAERATAIGDAERAVRAAEAEAARLAAEVKVAGGRARSAELALRRQRDLAGSGAFSQPSLQTAQRELSDARADLEGAQREAVVHRAQLERSERLYRQELVSRIEVENARLDVEKDRIAQERATRAIEIARVAYERERTIGRRGLLNAREIGTAEADLRAARLDAERARISLRSAGTAVGGARRAALSAREAYAALRGSSNAAAGGRLTIAAPIAGVVVHREVTAGAALERTTELFEIDDAREVAVTAQVPEREIVGLRPGAEVSVTVASFPKRRFAGRIATIGGRLDPKTRTLPVICRVANADGALRPEMFAEVTLGRGGTRQALAVPRTAVYEDGGATYAYVEESPGRYGRRAVTLGAAREGDVEIVAGLKEGERVVIAGVFTLRSQAQKDELKGHED